MTHKGRIVIAGDAGYIGSHVVLQLPEAGEHVVVLDDLSAGFRDAVIGAEFVVGDVGDRPLVKKLLRKHAIDAVMHFAVHTIVSESVAGQLHHYDNNTCAACNLPECCRDVGVDQAVFSSIDAIYGAPESGKASEESLTASINPYGASKLMSERMLRDLASAGGPRYVVLRYFDVAGCNSRPRIGQSTKNATLFVRTAGEVALGKRTQLSIFGADYDTPGGTGVRDYIHVEDLALAHVDELNSLREGRASVTLNCGYGHGYSALEILAANDRAHDAPVPFVEQSRRVGDLPSLIAIADKIRNVLRWMPRHDDLDFIVRTSLVWERMLMDRNASMDAA